MLRTTRLGIGALGTALGLTLAAPAQPPGAQPPDPIPVTGKSAPLLAPIDQGIADILLRHGLPGAALAITKDGRLVLAKGYGWANLDTDEPVRATTAFPLASVSKVFTALAILKLVEAGKLTLEDKPFEILKDIPPPPGDTVNPQLYRITVRHLLMHAGGWNRNLKGDPINWTRRVAHRLQVRRPITDVQLTSYMLSQPLDFEPGTDNQYSNFGFIVLGQVIAKVSGQPYEQVVRQTILEPLGMKATKILDHDARYFPDEARRYLSGSEQLLPAFTMPWADATGGWKSTVVDLAKLLTALEGSRGGKPFLKAETMAQMLAPPTPPLRPRDDGTWWGLGWDQVKTFPQGAGFAKNGSWTGIRTSIKRNADGTCVVLLFNASVELDPIDVKIAKDAVMEIHEMALRTKEWPNVDLFRELP